MIDWLIDWLIDWFIEVFFILLGEESVWQDKEKDKKWRVRLCGGYRFGGGGGLRVGQRVGGRPEDGEGCYGRN